VSGNIQNKRDPIRVQTALALPAAGAFTSATLAGPAGQPGPPYDVRLARWATLRVAVVPGSATSAVQFIVLASYTDRPNNLPFAPITLVNGAIVAVAAPISGFATQYNAWILRTQPGVTAAFPFGPFSVNTMKWLEFQFAEFGDLVNPATITVDLVLDEGAGV
jgi:hypothetical protein